MTSVYTYSLKVTNENAKSIPSNQTLHLDIITGCLFKGVRLFEGGYIKFCLQNPKSNTDFTL